MPISAGQIGLDLKINGKDYKKQVKQYGDYGSKQLQGSFSNTFKSIGKMAVGAFAIAGIAKFTQSCLKLGSDLTEVQNVVDVAFPKMNDQINNFAKNAMTQFGMSETVAKKYAGTFGAMSKAFGFTEQASADMAMELTGLAGDVASFYNMNTDEAYTKLKSVFTGETETLKELGVVMTQNALDQYALANGYGKTTAKMSEQEKVALRMKFVTDQLSLASGDFVRTQDSWANQTRVLSLRFDQLKASLGKGFIALFTPIVKGINWVLSNLQPLADSFASLFEMLTGYSGDAGGGALADTAGDIAGATEGADGLSDGLTDAGKSGEKAAKKINKAFAKVDTINKLTFGSDEGSEDSGSVGGSGSNGSVADAVDFAKPSKDANVFNGMLDGIIKEFKRLSDLFMTGFNIGFGDSLENVEKIKINLSSIGDSIVNIFTDPKVLKAGRSWLDSLYVYWGKMIGSFASIGISIATLVVGSIAEYLNSNAEFIKNKLVQLFKISEKGNVILGDFYVMIADIASIFASNKAIQIGANFIEGIANGFIGSFVLLTRLGVDILDCIVSPLLENKGLIKTTVESMLAPIEEVTGTIAQGITDTFKTVDEVYKKYLSPSFERIKKGLSSVFKTVLENYNKYFKPVFDMIAENFSILWTNTIQPAINSIVEFFGKLFEVLSIIWSNVLAPFVEWLVSVFGPIFSTVFENVWKVVEWVFTLIFELVQGAMTFFGGVCEFLSGVFTLDWQKAWDGICGIFNGIWDTMQAYLSAAITFVSTIIDTTLSSISSIWEGAWNGISVFFGDIWEGIKTGVSDAIENVKKTIETVLGTIKGVWEGMWSGLERFVSGTWDNILKLWNSGGKIFTNITDGIGTIFRNIVNGLIDGFNKIIKAPLKVISNALKTIHDIDLPLIGKPFTIVPRGFDIPQIPHLAQGGYVKANQPQLAMIGDNKRYGEVVAPENKMIDMINTALAMQKETGSVSGLDTVIKLIKELINAVAGLVLKVDIDMKKLSILLENAQKERQMIGG